MLNKVFSNQYGVFFDLVFPEVKDITKIWKQRVERNLFEGVRLSINQMIQGMKNATPGRRYRKTITHPLTGKKIFMDWVASAYGSYPAERTGSLLKMLRDPSFLKENIIVEWEGNTAYAYLRIDPATAGKYMTVAAYANILETVDPSAGGRPWNRRAFEETKAALDDLLGTRMVSQLFDGIIATEARRRDRIYE